MQWQVIFAGVLFLVVYGVIISEKIHRTVIALFGAVLLILAGILTQEEAVHFIDFNTIGLLTGMMIIVTIARQSGMFEYMAIYSARIAGGHPLKIMVALSLVTAFASAFLDNVTTVLLIAPVTIAICDKLEISPVPMFVAEILSSNLGGTATLIGDPPNIMIGSAAHLSFMDFVINLTGPIIVILVVTLLLLALVYRRDLVADEEKQKRIRDMNPIEAIKDFILLRRSLMVLGLVILGFLLHERLGLESATIALFGAALLFLVTRESPDDILLGVEWPTLFFFIGLFILVGGLEKVGIIEKVAREVVELTGGSLKAMTLTVLWVSAIASAFVDNIPFVATFIPMIKDIAHFTGMPIEPLWWALSLGACLGGNGTLIGASANVIISGIASREGHPISFLYYLKIAFPLMLVSIVISMFYLLLFHL